MNFVLRRRLIDRFDERLGVRLTLVEAGPGFGKTTLVQQVLEHSELLEQAVDIVVRCRPVGSDGDNAGEVLGAIGAALDVAPTIESITDGMLAASPDDVVIWVDDVHHLSGDTSWLRLLIAGLPGNGHLVLVGRTLPDIPVSRLEIHGQVARFTEDDLRFDPDERAAFAHLRSGAMESDADGWPALMELELSAGRVGALGYLTEEVLGGLAVDRRTALRRLAHLDRFDDAMVRDATAFDGSAGDLVSGLPLVRIDTTDDGAISVELHDLLIGALRSEERKSERLINITAVAAVLLQHGDTAGAARRFASIGDQNGVRSVAERLIIDTNFANDVSDRLEVVEIANATLGDDVAALALAALTATIAEPAAATGAIASALRAARVAGRTDLEARLLRSASELAYSQSRTRDLEAYAHRLTELAESGEPAAIRIAFLPDLYLRRVTGRTQEIPTLVDHLIATDALVDDEMRAVALFYRTISLAYTGRVREALADAAKYGPGFPPGLFSDRIGGVIATQRWMLGELDADDLMRVTALVDQIERRGQMQLFVEGAASTSIFHATNDRIDTARDLLARAERALLELRDHAWSHHTVPQAEAVLAVIDGDEERAAQLLDAAMPPDGPIASLPSHVYFVTAALSYVLVPRSRAAWDNAPVSPDMDLRTRVGAALVAFRESGDATLAAALPWSEPHRIRPWAVEPHLVELAVAAIAEGTTSAAAVLTDLRTDPTQVLDRLAAASNPAVADAVKQTIKLTPRRPDTSLSIGVLGPLSIVRNGIEEVESAVWRKARVIDLLLLLVHERKVSRDHAAFSLWPDKPRDAARNNLRSNLSLLLKAFEPDRVGTGPSWFVRTDGDMLRLDSSEALRVDVDQFRGRVERGQQLDITSPRLALPEHIAACELYRGDYLDGWAVDDAAYYEALRIRGEFVSTATRAADLLLSMGEFDRAESFAMAASGAEPLNESAMRVLAASLLAQRRIGAAGEVLGSLLRHLADLQIPPEPETRRLAARLKITS